MLEKDKYSLRAGLKKSQARALIQKREGNRNGNGR
jgi:hypothetical protein